MRKIEYVTLTENRCALSYQLSRVITLVVHLNIWRGYKIIDFLFIFLFVFYLFIFVK